MRKIYSLLFVLLFSAIVKAQTVVWQMPLSDYDTVERINKSLFKVTRNGKIGLINSDGSLVAEPIHDALGDYYEHKALLTVIDGHGERMAGCLTDEGRYYSYENKFYTLAGQKFFSENIISVADENGKVGYVDVSGNIVLGFDGKYDRIKPFVDGHAAVFKNKKYSLIDKDGIAVRFQLPGVGEIYGGTNSSNNIVSVWDGDGNLYTYDLSTTNSICKKSGKIKKVDFDYLYRLSVASDKDKNVPFSKFSYTGSKGFEPVSEDGKMGFATEGTIVLPCQLTKATPFEDGLSVISMEGKMGILRLIDGDSFGMNCPDTEHKFYSGDAVICNFTLAIPSVWREKELKVVVKDANDISVTTTNTSNSYSFEVKPTQAETREYRVAVYAERLKLYETSISYSFTRLCKKCHKDFNVCHGKHDEEKVERRCPTCGKLWGKCPKDFEH